MDSRYLLMERFIDVKEVIWKRQQLDSIWKGICVLLIKNYISIKTLKAPNINQKKF